MNKTKFSTKYTALINRAAAIAKKEGGAQIERRHLLAALCAMAPKHLNRLVGRNQLYFVGELPFQDVSSLEPCKIAFSSAAYRVLSLYGGVLGKVVEATDANLIDIYHVGAALLIDDSADSPVQEWLNANGLSLNKAEVIERVKRLGRKGAKKRSEREIYRAVANIRMQMLDGIVGQEHAVSKVCDSLLGNWLLPQENRRPLTIMLCGDRGSGKSLFATKLTEAIVHNRDSVTVTFLSGGMFASENTSHDIPGYGPGWKAQSMGLVTGPVSKNPEEIIVMEDFDLLHPIARSHMLKVLTTARLMDEMLGREVDFSRAMIILICSAGCDTAKLGDTNMEKTRARIVEEIVSGMTESNRRDNVMALGEVATEVVMMKGLTADELRKVLVHTIDAEVLSIKNTISKKVVVDTNRLADVMLEGVCSLRPSGIAPMVKANVGDPIRKAIMESNGAKVKSVEVVIDSDSEVDVNTVAKNLAMRRRRLVTASASFEESRLVLRISSGDFVLLPAVCDGFIRILPPKAGDSFDKLVGLEKPIAVLRHCIKYMHGETNINPGGGGFLFVGAPGTGKSCLARSLAYEAGVPYALLNCAELTSPEAIINVFNKLRLYGKSGLVAIFDEIDGIGGDRDDNKSSAYIERLNLLLENIDGIANDPESRIVYVGLSNRMEAIDGALLRDGRFGRVVNFRGLDAAGRRKLLAMEISECGITPAPDEKILDLMAKTTNGMPGSMLKAIVHELAIMASESGPLTREMYAKARKIVMHGEGTTTVELSDEQLLSCAVHEAGHALACDFAGRDFNLASIVEDDPSRLGCVEPAEKTHCTGASILASIDIALAGLAGQEVMGLPPSGGGSDLHKAKELAFDYIRNGFCRDWGLLYLEEPNEKMMALANKILDERYSKVSKLLLDARPILSRFAKMLSERKVLFHDDLRMIKNSFTRKGAEYGKEV